MKEPELTTQISVTLSLGEWLGIYMTAKDAINKRYSTTEKLKKALLDKELVKDTNKLLQLATVTACMSINEQVSNVLENGHGKQKCGIEKIIEARA